MRSIVEKLPPQLGSWWHNAFCHCWACFPVDLNMQMCGKIHIALHANLPLPVLCPHHHANTIAECTIRAGCQALGLAFMVDSLCTTLETPVIVVQCAHSK